jgi:hypothetical protein
MRPFCLLSVKDVNDDRFIFYFDFQILMLMLLLGLVRIYFDEKSMLICEKRQYLRRVHDK